MKNFALGSLAIAIFVISTLVFLGSMTEVRIVADEDSSTLRAQAQSRSLRSTPLEAGKLLDLVSSKQNPITRAKVEFGKELFFDASLSKHGKTSCASCHSLSRDVANPPILGEFVAGKDEGVSDCASCHLRDQSGVDRFTFSQGDNATPHPKLLNVQTVLNSGFFKHYTWSGEVGSIADEAKRSFEAKHKHALSSDEVVARVANDPKYTEFVDSNLSIDTIANAIEAYVKTLVTYGAYDRFMDGDDDALSHQAKRGLANFMRFGCSGCHGGVALGGTTLQHFPLRAFAFFYELRLNESLFDQLRSSDSRLPFDNSGGFLGRDDALKFRVPTLRNVTKTSPYFHNGAVEKIYEAVDIMARHQLGRRLSDEQISEIVAFLRSLEGEIVEYELK